MTPCELAKNLESFSKDFFEQERSSKRWRILETSFTDVMIAAFSRQKFASVKVDASIEPQTGADLEILFSLPNSLAILFIIQAKRYKPSSKNSKNWSYTELFHKTHKTGKHQVDILINHCGSSANRSVPLYAFYHSATASLDLGVEGVTLLDACHVHNELKRTGKNRLSCKHYTSKSYPFSDLFFKISPGKSPPSRTDLTSRYPGSILSDFSQKQEKQ